ANSAYFGVPSSVTDLNKAIVLLGFSAVRNLTLAACLKSMYRPVFRFGTFTAESLWLHGVSVAVIGQMLSRRTWPDLAHDVFLAGILHDVGIIVEWNLLPQRFEQVVRGFEGMGLSFVEAEKRALGFDHQACGSAILRQWKLPKDLAYMARHHHDPKILPADLFAEKVGSPQRVLALIQLAECVCAERGNGFMDQLRDDEVTGELLAKVGCGWSDYRGVVETLDAELKRARSVLAL
ncbi:MAG: HDOD domain-containing protein, partial [Phycisphaerae bacterium]